MNVCWGKCHNKSSSDWFCTAKSKNTDHVSELRCTLVRHDEAPAGILNQRGSKKVIIPSIRLSIHHLLIRIVNQWTGLAISYWRTPQFTGHYSQPNNKPTPGMEWSQWVWQRILNSRLQLKCNGTRWRTGGEVKGKLANGVGSQYHSHYLWTWCIQHYCQ